MPEVEVTAGRIAYQDTGGDGPVVVMIPGLLMDWKQWRKVIDELAPEFRCVSPSLPTGAHWKPMNRDADLSLIGMGRIVTEFLEAADLRDVTLCFNDWCGAQVMIADGGMDRVGKLVLVSCETAGNYPPGLAGFAAVPYIRAASLFVRVANLGGRMQQIADAVTYRLTVDKPTMIPTPIANPAGTAKRATDCRKRSGRHCPELGASASRKAGMPIVTVDAIVN